MLDIMIDIETMGTSTDSAIMAIGAAAFDITNGNIISTFYQPVSLKSHADMGGVIDASTVIWWMGQSDSARRKFINNDEALHLSQALQSFSEWVNSQPSECKVWGNGATFDITIMENAYKLAGMTPPWKFWNIRDVRTIVDLAKEAYAVNVKSEVPFVGTPHCALDDAVHQAKYVSMAYHWITE